jgi:hypothetical protein
MPDQYDGPQMAQKIMRLQEDCIRLQQEINCLRMEPCLLPKCVEARAEVERLSGKTGGVR